MICPESKEASTINCTIYFLLSQTEVFYFHQKNLDTENVNDKDENNRNETISDSGEGLIEQDVETIVVDNDVIEEIDDTEK